MNKTIPTKTNGPRQGDRGEILLREDFGFGQFHFSCTFLHNESEDAVVVDIEFGKNMNELVNKVCHTEVTVAEYSIGYDVHENSVLIYEYHAWECKNSVFLNTSLGNTRMRIKTYVGVHIGVPDGTTGTIFTLIPLTVTYRSPKRVAVNQRDIPNRGGGGSGTKRSLNVLKLINTTLLSHHLGKRNVM